MKIRLSFYSLVLLSLVFLSSNMYAQLPGIKVYTQLDGFPGTVGYLINQDSKGFIWVATDNGAACFDGKKFRTVDDKDGLGDKELLDILPFSNNYVCFVPLLNNIAYSKNGKVITSSTNKSLASIKNVITNIFRLDVFTKKIWAGDFRNSNLLHCFSGDTITKVEVKINNTFEVLKVINNQMYFFEFDSSTLQRGKFGSYDLINHVATPFEFVKTETGNTFNPTNFRQYEVSNDGKYLVVSHLNKTLELFKIVGNKVFHLHSIPLKNQIRVMRIDNNNHLWLSLTKSGIEYWGEIIKINSDSKALYLLDDIIINDLFVDRDKNLWLTTERKGLFFLSSMHWTNTILTLKLQLPSLPTRYVTGSNNNIFIGYGGKPFLTLIRNGKSSLFNIPNCSPLGIRSITTYKNRVFVIAGILTTLKIIEGKLQFNSVTDYEAIKDIRVYNKDQLILARHSSAGVVNMDKHSNEKEGFIYLFKGRTTSVDVLPDSSILIGTPNGLYIKSSIKSEPVGIKNTVLAQAHITGIQQTMGNNVLVGTNAKGLYNYNYITGNVTHILIKNTTLSLVRSIFKQNDSIYWISTDKGAFRMHFSSNMQIQKVDTYTFFDGLPSSDVSSVYVQNDTAYMATNTGMAIIPLKNSTYQSAAPVLWFTDLRFDDSVIHFPSNEIRISHRQNNIQLSLSAISFESMGNIKYVYRLIGLSDKWVETESPEISFSGLSPGKYKLEAFAINSKGIKTNNQLALSIVILPAFWQTNWFRILLLVLIVAILLYAVYQLVVNEKNKQYNKMQQKKRLAELELEAIKAQINPHFVYNCLNSIQYFTYKNDFEQVKKYLDSFAKLIRQTMQYSQETFITLEEEIDYLNNYLKLEKVRFKEKLVYSIDVDQNINPLVMIPSMLLQPYAENAIKHGIAKVDYTGEVKIKFTQIFDDYIKVVIEDNGPGIQKHSYEQGRKPLGMRITGNRAETYNQLFGLDIRINIKGRENAQGLLIELLIPPIINEHTKL